MAVAFREKAENSAASGTTATGNRPTGTTDDDILLASVISNASSTTVTGVPTGWTLLQDDPAPADFSHWTYWKVASSEPASWDWTLSASGIWRVDVLAYSGSDGTINISTAEQVAAANAIAIGSMTTTVDGCMVVGFAAYDAGTAGTWTQDGAMTERIDSHLQSALSLSVADEIQSSAGAITRTFTQNITTQDLSGHLVAIAPAAEGGGATMPIYVTRARRIRIR